MNDNISAHLQVIVATFIIAGSFIATAYVSTQLHPISLTLLRFAIATAVLAPFVLTRKGNAKKLLNVLPRSMIISFFFCGYFACNFIAMLSTTAINVGSIYTLTPLVTAIFSVLFFKHKLTLSNLIVYLLGMLGTLWVVFQGNLDLLVKFELNNGDLVFSLGVLLMSGYTIAMKLLYRGDDIKVMTLANLLGGVIWMSLATIIMDVSLGWVQLGYEYYPSMLYLAVAATFLTSYLYQSASTVLHSVNLSAYIYLNPLCVALLSLSLYDQHTDAWIWVGIVISAIATFVLQYLGRRA